MASSRENNDKLQNGFCSLIIFLGYKPIKMYISTTRTFPKKVPNFLYFNKNSRKTI